MKFYQTADAKETIAIKHDPDGSISIGIARAGRLDIQQGMVSRSKGMRIASGRCIKARTHKTAMIERNYLRGIHAMPVEV